MCKDVACPLKDKCYRFTAIPNKHYQSFFGESPRQKEKCEYFLMEKYNHAPTGIGVKWSKFATQWVGNKEGIHCHWCKYIKTDKGIAWCEEKESPFNNDERIYGWGGNYCADQCPVFKLDEFYQDDDNFPPKTTRDFKGKK